MSKKKKQDVEQPKLKIVNFVEALEVTDLLSGIIVSDGLSIMEFTLEIVNQVDINSLYKLFDIFEIDTTKAESIILQDLSRVIHVNSISQMLSSIQKVI